MKVNEAPKLTSSKCSLLKLSFLPRRRLAPCSCRTIARGEATLSRRAPHFFILGWALHGHMTKCLFKHVNSEPGSTTCPEYDYGFSFPSLSDLWYRPSGHVGQWVSIMMFQRNMSRAVTDMCMSSTPLNCCNFQYPCSGCHRISSMTFQTKQWLFPDMWTSLLEITADAVCWHQISSTLWQKSQEDPTLGKTKPIGRCPWTISTRKLWTSGRSLPGWMAIPMIELVVRFYQLLRDWRNVFPCKSITIGGLHISISGPLISRRRPTPNHLVKAH